MKGTIACAAWLGGACAAWAQVPGEAPSDAAAAAELWRSNAWSAQVELRVSDASGSVGPRRRLSASWDPEAGVATLRMSRLRVWADGGRVVVWNPLHAGEVFEVVRDGAGASALIADALPPVLMPALSFATGGDGLFVGRGTGVVWDGRVGEGAHGVSVEADFEADPPWASVFEVSTSGGLRYTLRMSDGRGAVALPADWDTRERVGSIAALAGRAGDIEVGDMVPSVRFGVVGRDRSWPLMGVFASEGRQASAFAVFLVDPQHDLAGTAAALVGETRRTLARWAVNAGRPAESFPGLIARPAFVVELGSYDPGALDRAKAAWGVLPGQPGFETAEAATPAALWAPRAELLERLAPRARGVVAIVSAEGRLEAFEAFYDGVDAGALAERLADAIAPDLVPVEP